MNNQTISPPIEQEIDYTPSAPSLPPPGGILDTEPAPSELKQKKAPPKPSVVGGAATIGAAAGFAVFGPVGAVVAGAGMATAAIADENGLIGKSARGGGKAVSKFNKEHKITEKAKSAVVSTGKTIGQLNDKHRPVDKIKHFEQKNKITDKAKAGTKKTVDYVKEFGAKHKVAEKTNAGVKSAVNSAKEFNEKHQVLEKSAAAGKSVIKSFGNFMKETNKK